MGSNCYIDSILCIYIILISLISPKFAALSSVKIWGKLILTISGVRLKINGLQNIKNKPTIVMYNHKSIMIFFHLPLL